MEIIKTGKYHNIYVANRYAVVWADAKAKAKTQDYPLGQIIINLLQFWLRGDIKL
jgi:hypothetical protein